MGLLKNSVTTYDYKNNLVPVMTTKQVATAFGVSESVISMNFSRNKSRYVEKKHYFKLGKRDITNCCNLDVPSNTTVFFLWTQRGVLNISKSIGTDVAWDIYEVLVDTYFKYEELVKQEVKQLHSCDIDDPIERTKVWIKEQQKKIEIMEANKLLEEDKKKLEGEKIALLPKANFHDMAIKSKDVMSMDEVAKLINLKIHGTNKSYGRNKIFEILREEEIVMKSKKENIPYQDYVDTGYFKLVERLVGEQEYPRVVKQIVVFQKGVELIRQLLEKRNEKLKEKEQEIPTANSINLEVDRSSFVISVL